VISISPARATAACKAPVGSVSQQPIRTPTPARRVEESSTMGFKVAVVGATGNVGREILKTLAEREFPADDVVALASSNSVGSQVSFGEDDVLDVQALDSFDFRGTDIVLSSPGSKVSAAFAPRAAKA